MHLFLALLLATFVFQTSALRGHIHIADAGAHELADGTAGGGSHKPAHNEANCPLWHASSVCGAGLVATAATIPAPLQLAEHALLDKRSAAPERFAAAWRSRAPPLL